MGLQLNVYFEMHAAPLCFKLNRFYRTSFFVRQLLSDYHERCFIGFVICLWVLPATLASQDETISPEDFAGIFSTDSEAQDKASKAVYAKREKTVQRNPLVKIMIQGAFHEMIDRGFFDKYK